MIQVRGLRPPRQQRSEETLERILDAAERMLDGRDPEGIPVLEIISEASVSSSSFYARFGDKQALVRALHERHFDRLASLGEQVIGSTDWDELSLPEICRRLVAVFVRYRGEHKGRIRSFRLAEQRMPELAQRRLASDARLLSIACDYFERRLEGRGRSFDRGRLLLASYLMAWSVEAAESAPDHLVAAIGVARGDDWLASETARMMIGYLGLTEED